ncbi:hypothetical protein I302_103026 [Kwoniella bestiolae CBS 10118]|uniref:Uncharacterized protein n=1 Tax=Kwoniella bestiolae CBS 10118 TaxID=1296100 RepID=A0A1B9GGM4_9TREE|nr:hypothetical protein I302_01722 [Kwoniella bestiolae CBS 10118]OCF30203.1 hypothetical protein I302_01722 [Kwoniella bestiolae CBS 10118]
MNEKLLQLHTTIGIPSSMICYITRHHDLSKNPIASEVHHVLSLGNVKDPRAALDHAGVRKLSKSEQKKVKDTYFRNHKNRIQAEVDSESDRIRGWKLMAETNDKLRAYFGDIDDRALFEIFHVDLSKHYDIIRHLWKQDLTNERIETVSGIVRWSYGTALGYLAVSLASEKRETSGFLENIISQTYDPVIKDFSGPARMAREWFSGPFITAELAQGRGLLPFDPFCRASYPAAVSMRKHDANLVDEVFEKICKSYGIDTNRGVLEITASPYDYSRHHQRAVGLGMKMMHDIIQQRTNRVAGPVGLVWQCIADYLDRNACLNEKRRFVKKEHLIALGKLWVASDKPAPLEMMQAAPESSQKKLRSQDTKDKAIAAFKEHEKSLKRVQGPAATSPVGDDDMDIDL